MAVHHHGNLLDTPFPQCVIVLQVTHHFELINYSEHGSVVNGQLYSCDFTRGAAAGAGDAAATGAEEKAAALRAIADKRRGVTTTITTTSTTVANGPG